MIARAAIIVGLSLAFTVPCRAESDVRLWLQAGVSKKLGKRFALSFEQHLRFYQDISRLEAVIPELGVTYRVHKRVRLALGYRLQYERDKDDVLVLRDRVHVDVRPRIKLGPCEVTYRLRFQEEVRGSFAADNLRHTLRNQLAVALASTKPWIPAVAVETHHRLYDEEPIRLQRIWLTVSFAYEHGRHEMEVFYRVALAQYDETAPTAHIIGIGYHTAI